MALGLSARPSGLQIGCSGAELVGFEVGGNKDVLSEEYFRGMQLTMA